MLVLAQDPSHGSKPGQFIHVVEVAMRLTPRASGQWHGVCGVFSAERVDVR